MRYVFLTLICLGIVVATNFNTFKGYVQAAAPKPETVFQVGDCYYFTWGTAPEAWETRPQLVRKILQIGESNYWVAVRVEIDSESYWITSYDLFSSDEIKLVKEYGTKVVCPKTTDNNVYINKGTI